MQCCFCFSGAHDLICQRDCDRRGPIIYYEAYIRTDMDDFLGLRARKVLKIIIPLGTLGVGYPKQTTATTTAIGSTITITDQLSSSSIGKPVAVAWQPFCLQCAHIWRYCEIHFASSVCWVGLVFRVIKLIGAYHDFRVCSPQ